MNEETIRRIVAEEPLDLAGAMALDEALDKGAPIAAIVAGLPDHEPSLAWRSELNAKLAAGAPKPKRQARWLWMGSLGLGTALACALLVAPRPEAPGPRSADPADIESALAQALGETEASANAGVTIPDWGG
jgi:hypothetical protein